MNTLAPAEPLVVIRLMAATSHTERVRAAGYAGLQLRLLRRLVLAEDLAPDQRAASWSAWLANEFAHGMDVPAEWLDWSIGAPAVVAAIEQALAKTKDCRARFNMSA